MGVSQRVTFPSPWHIRYLIESDMPMTETVRGSPDHFHFSLTDNEREALYLPYLGKKTAPFGSGLKLPLPWDLRGLCDSRGLHTCSRSIVTAAADHAKRAERRPATTASSSSSSSKQQQRQQQQQPQPTCSATTSCSPYRGAILPVASP